MQKTKVRAQKISCRRNGATVLSDLSFAAGSGDFLVFTGPNGIGKTTLLRTLAGIAEISSGTLTVPEEDAVFLGHENGLKPTLTVAENLRFWAGVFGQKIDGDSIEMFDIARLLSRQVRHLSSGQQRRLAIVTAAVSNRRLWLMDEPTAGLDDQSSAAFEAVAERHCASGGILVASTHAAFKNASCAYLDLSLFRPAGAESGTDK